MKERLKCLSKHLSHGHGRFAEGDKENAAEWTQVVGCALDVQMLPVRAKLVPKSGTELDSSDRFVEDGSCFGAKMHAFLIVQRKAEKHAFVRMHSDGTGVCDDGSCWRSNGDRFGGE